MITTFLLALSLTQAIIQVESGGDDNAVGDNGKAISALQIHEAYFKDAQEFDKSLAQYTYQDVKKREVAIKVFWAWMSRYCTKKRLGREPTDTDRMRMHNGGCNAYKFQNAKKEANLLKYVAKVKLAMKRDEK